LSSENARRNCGSSQKRTLRPAKRFIAIRPVCHNLKQRQGFLIGFSLELAAPSGMAEPDSIATPSGVSSHAASSPSERASRVLSRRSWGAFTARGCMRV
jgi:hypothetical protein